MSDHPVPTARARELVRGGFDPYVHAAPDFAPRRITDLELAERCLELGLAGFALTSHYTATAERAAVVNAAVGNLARRRHDRAQPCGRRLERDRGGGGRAPGRADRVAADGQRHRARSPRSRAPTPTATCRSGCASSASCGPRARRRAPVPVLDADGAPLPELLAVLRRGRAARARARDRPSLARGDFAVVDAAVAAGVETIVVTNPEFPSHKLSPDDQVAARGARRAVPARADDALHRQVHVGRALRGDARGGCRADGLGQRPRASVQPAGRRRAGPPGRPLPRRRLQRGGDPDHGGREHAEAGRCLSGCR